MGVVHSTQLGHANGISTAGNTLYTVPTARRTIVKSIVIQNNAAGTNRVVIGLFLAGGTNVSFGVTLGAASSATESINYQCWIVLNVGDSLKVTPGSDFVAAIASGAELHLN